MMLPSGRPPTTRSICQHPLLTTSIGDPEEQSLASRTREVADHAGPSPPLVPSRESMPSEDTDSSHSQSNNSSTAPMVRTTVAVVDGPTEPWPMPRRPNWTQRLPTHTEEPTELAEPPQAMSASQALDTSLPAAQTALPELPTNNQFQFCSKLTRESSNHTEVVSLVPALAVELLLITPSSWSDTPPTHGSSRTHGVPDGVRLVTSDSRDGLVTEVQEFAESSCLPLFHTNEDHTIESEPTLHYFK